MLAPESQGFSKADLTEFMGYLQDSTQLNKKILEEANIEKFTKECNIKDAKNQRGQMSTFMDKVLRQELASLEQKLIENPKL